MVDNPALRTTLADFRSDAKQLRERYATESTVEARLELADNVIPLLEGIMEALDAKFAEHDEELDNLGEGLDELIDQSNDAIHPDTAEKIASVLEVGKMMADELEKNLKKLDDVTRKKVTQYITAYRSGADMLFQMLEEITIPDDDADPLAQPSDPDDDPDDDVGADLQDADDAGAE
jgi:ABC-type transporter Mla subunit MlaD